MKLKLFKININKMYKKQVDCFWRVEEVDLSKDMVSWNTLNEDEQYFIKMINLLIIYLNTKKMAYICSQLEEVITASLLGGS